MVCFGGVIPTVRVPRWRVVYIELCLKFLVLASETAHMESPNAVPALPSINNRIAFDELPRWSPIATRNMGVYEGYASLRDESGTWLCDE